ncbi:Ataxin-7-like protein 3, partial [Geodia barretti]
RVCGEREKRGLLSRAMARNGDGDMTESIMHQLIDEEALGVAFEMHRAIKLGYYELVYPDESSYEKHDVIDMKGYDIFGNTQQSLQKNVDCQCPNCDRTLGATKFAPHLEKCMGMGRNSTRLANRK